MHATTAQPRGLLRLLIVSAIVFAATSAGLTTGRTGAQEATADPTMTPTEALCDSRDDMALIVGFLRSLSFEEDGLLPFAVGAIAGISETRQLLGLVGETYRPLVEDLVVGFEDLRAGVDELEAEGTIGSKIEAVARPIADIGAAMDALSMQLREPCPA